LDALAEMLSLEATAVSSDSGEINDLTKNALSETVFNIGEIDVEGVLAYQVRHPAKAFLRTQKVHVVQGEEAMAHQEPLFLDNLTTYQIKEYLINELASDAANNNSDRAAKQDSPILMYQKIMPAGVARQTTLPNQQQEQLIANGWDNGLDDAQILEASDIGSLQLLTPTTEHPVQIELAAILNHADNAPLLKLLPQLIKIKGSVPISVPTSIPTSVSIDANNNRANLQAGVSYAEQSPKQWLNILPNSASPKHLIKFWLSHLYWQVARR